MHVPEVVTNASGDCSVLYVKQGSQDNQTMKEGDELHGEDQELIVNCIDHT